VGFTSFASIVNCLKALQRQKICLLVAIDGLGGAGKSTLAQLLEKQLRTLGWIVPVVKHDDFYLPFSQRENQATTEIGSDFDWKRLRDQVLIPIREGRSSHYQRYDWEADVLAEWHTISASDVVLVEGVYTMRCELTDLYDLKIWVECPRAIRLARGIARDGEKARSIWEQDWMPKEDYYVKTHLPRERADLSVIGATSYLPIGASS
jgi:uridine kinase